MAGCAAPGTAGAGFVDAGALLSAAPHLLQNCAPSAFAVPHWLQNIVLPPKNARNQDCGYRFRARMSILRFAKRRRRLASPLPKAVVHATITADAYSFRYSDRDSCRGQGDADAFRACEGASSRGWTHADRACDPRLPAAEGCAGFGCRGASGG